MTLPHLQYIINEPKVSEARHIKWINLAKKMALKSNYIKYRMAAICIKSGRIIGVGFNKHKDGYAKDKKYFQRDHHAELDLILSIDKDILKGSEVYVAGLTRAGSCVWSSKPCPICQQNLKQHGIKAAYFHDSLGDVYVWRANEIRG